MFNKKDLSIAIAAALALQVSQLHAQDSASPENNILEEVKVTATKREVSAQDIPANIPVVDEQRLRESYIYDISRLSQVVPGLNVIDYGADNARDIVIRGMKNTGLQEYTTSGTTNIFMDDTLLGSTNLEINDVERVEVLRGPQGVLYGGGSVGGTIRYVTHRPDPGRYGGWVEAGVSSTRDVSDLGWETRTLGAMCGASL